MNTSIVLHPSSDNARAILPKDASGDTKHRLDYFIQWLDERGQRWIDPDLAAYRDYLMSEARQVPGKGGALKPSPLSPASTQAHLATIRGRYKKLMDDNATRERIYATVPQDASPADKKAMVDELLTRLENATKPGQAKVTVIKHQDEIDADHLRLTRAQADALLQAPRRRADNTPQQAIRDTAMIALMLCTGVREMELCALDVEDLRQATGGELSLHIRKGKGAKARAIPYGALDWALALVEKWLSVAGITTGPVFRGFYKNGKSVRVPTEKKPDPRLSVRSVNKVMDRYPIAINGSQRTVNPHDCRRTYARRLYEEGVDPVKIQQNLGHSDLKTTLHYIGALNMDQRRPPSIYDAPDLSEYDALI